MTTQPDLTIAISDYEPKILETIDLDALHLRFRLDYFFSRRTKIREQDLIYALGGFMRLCLSLIRFEVIVHGAFDLKSLEDELRDSQDTWEISFTPESTLTKMVFTRKENIHV